MAPPNQKRIKLVRNAPKGLSSEFHPIRSHTGTTSFKKTANGTDPLVKRTGPVNSIAAPLASLAPLLVRKSHLRVIYVI